MTFFSIITVVYNRAEMIEDAMKSVFEQTHKLFEYIIIDGGSTDGTLDVINKYTSKNITIICEPDEGIYDALNKGFSLARGDVIGIMHSDDFYAYPDVLRDVSNIFSSQKVDAVYGDLDYVSASNKDRVIRKWRSCDFRFKNLSLGWMPPHPTLFISRSSFQRLGGFDVHYSVAADYDFILRYFSSNNFQSAYIPKVLVKMRLGGISNGSILKLLQKYREDLLVLRKNRIGGLISLFTKNLLKVKQYF